MMRPLCSLLFQGGMYMLQLLDNYAATYTTLTIGILECIALCHVYGETTIRHFVMWNIVMFS